MLEAINFIQDKTSNIFTLYHQSLQFEYTPALVTSFENFQIHPSFKSIYEVWKTQSLLAASSIKFIHTKSTLSNISSVLLEDLDIANLVSWSFINNKLLGIKYYQRYL